MSQNSIVPFSPVSPIVIVAFNRPEIFRATVSSLAANPLAEKSDLYIFIDGPRDNLSGEKEKVQQVIAIANNVKGFKTVTIKASKQNKGLANSIIGAATEVLNEHGTVILIEDDLYLSSSFLSYMNTMLNAYRKDSRIMQVTGYSTKIRQPNRFCCDYYLTRRAHSWSWGTWKDRWDTVDWEVKDYDDLLKDKAKQAAFCEFGSDLFSMLKGWHDGKNNSWFIRFAYAMFKQGRFSVAPIHSLVRNDGFGIDASNCKNYNRYIIDFQMEDKQDWAIKQDINWVKVLDKEATRFWSIPYRIYGKIMTFIKNGSKK